MKTVWVLTIKDIDREAADVGVFASKEKAEQYLDEYCRNALEADFPADGDAVREYFDRTYDSYDLFERVIIGWEG